MHEFANELQALLEEVVPQPLDDHVALSRRHGLVVYAEDQRLVGLFYSDAPRALQKKR